DSNGDKPVRRGFPAWKEAREEGQGQQPCNGDQGEDEKQMQVEFDSAVTTEAESASPQHTVTCRRASMAHTGETHEHGRWPRGARYVPQPLNHFSTLPSHSAARNHNAAGIW